MLEKCSLPFQKNISMALLSLNCTTVGMAQCTKSLHFSTRPNAAYILTVLTKLGGDQEECALEMNNPVW